MNDFAKEGFTYDDSEFRDLIKKIRTRMGNTQPATEIIGEVIHASILRNFEEGGRPTKWPELAESTKKQRRKKNKWPGQILVVQGVRGGLLGSISYKAADDEVVFVANKPYAAIQHFGGQAGPKRKVTIPARPYMMIQDDDWKEIKDALENFLLEVS